MTEQREEWLRIEQAIDVLEEICSRMAPTSENVTVAIDYATRMSFWMGQWSRHDHGDGCTNEEWRNSRKRIDESVFALCRRRDRVTFQLELTELAWNARVAWQAVSRYIPPAASILDCEDNKNGEQDCEPHIYGDPPRCGKCRTYRALCSCPIPPHECSVPLCPYCD